MTGTAKATVLKLLLADLGKVCAAYHDEHVRNVRSKRVQCDEIWSFIWSDKRMYHWSQWKRVCGDVWTWTAIDADSKLIVSFEVAYLFPAIQTETLPSHGLTCTENVLAILC
jgi:hypothetical protein